MKNILNYFYTASIFSIALITFGGCTHEKAESEETPKEMSQAEKVERGRYLVSTIGCNDCHTPKVFVDGAMKFNEELLLSGHPQDEALPEIDETEVTPGKWYLASSGLTAWVGPWGVSYAANLTPDNATGSGMWTEELFLKMLRTGKFMGLDAGRNIMPPMPWEVYGQMTDDDLKSIFAYIQTIKPISNNVPAYVPPNEIASLKSTK